MAGLVGGWDRVGTDQAMGDEYAHLRVLEPVLL
jgi:hypothetical protein